VSLNFWLKVFFFFEGQRGQHVACVALRDPPAVGGTEGAVP
jgi:hypothetical protein